MAEIETDKATMGFETPEEGYLAKIIVAAGTKNVGIGKLVCIIVDSEDKIAAFKDYKDDGASAPAVSSAPTPSPAKSSPPPTTSSTSPPPPPSASAASISPMASSGDRVYASPLARRLANEQGLSLQGLKGSGLFGSVTSKDLGGASAATSGASSSTGVAVSGGQDIPISNVRGVIAKRLLESKQSIPHYYLTIEVRMDESLALRQKFNKLLEKEKIKISVNDFIIKGIAMASKKVPEGNSSWLGDKIRQ